MDSDEIDELASRIGYDYHCGDNVWDNLKHIKYANQARNFFLSHHRLKSYKFFRDYEKRWDMAGLHFSELLSQSDMWFEHGYYSMADFDEKRSRHYLNQVKVPENCKYHRRDPANQHPCNQGQPQPEKSYQPSKDDWRLVEKLK